MRCFFQQGGFCLSYKQFSRGVAEGLCRRPRKRSRALPSESPLSSASGRRNHGCVTSFFPVQKPALNSHKPRDMKRPSQKNRVTVQSGRTFQRSSLTGAADNNNDCLWHQNTLAFPLQPPHLRSTPPPAHIHTQTLAHTHICSNNGRLCSWPPQVFCLSIAWLYHQPNTLLPIVHSHTNRSLITRHSWHYEKHVGTRQKLWLKSKRQSKAIYCQHARDLELLEKQERI